MIRQYIQVVTLLVNLVLLAASCILAILMPSGNTLGLMLELWAGLAIQVIVILIVESVQRK